MSTVMGEYDSLVNHMGPVIGTTDTLEVSMYPKGDPGTTFIPSVDEKGNLSWTNDGNRPNPETRNIHGVDITDVEQTTVATEDGSTNVITISMSNGTSHEIQIKNGNTGERGNDGIDGKTPTIEIGQVTSGPVASVGNVGTDTNVVLDFVIPENTTKVILNGSEIENPNFYAATAAGQNGQVLISRGEGQTPEWEDYSSGTGETVYYRMNKLTNNLNQLLETKDFQKSLEVMISKAKQKKEGLSYVLQYTGDLSYGTPASIHSTYSYVRSISEGSNTNNNDNTSDSLITTPEIGSTGEGILGGDGTNEKVYNIIFNNINIYESSNSSNPSDRQYYIEMIAPIQNKVGIFGHRCENTIFKIRLDYNGGDTSGSFEGTITVDIYEITNSTLIITEKGAYTQEDLDRVKDIENNTITPTEEDFKKYDLDKDGKIDWNDESNIKQRIEYNWDKDHPITFGLTTWNGDSEAELPFMGYKDGAGNVISQFSPNYMEVQTVDTKVVYTSGVHIRNSDLSTNLGVPGFTTLFLGHENGTVTLSKNISDFIYIDIYYCTEITQGTVHNCTRVMYVDGETIQPSLMSAIPAGNVNYFNSKMIKIEGNTISNVGSRYMKNSLAAASASSLAAENNIYIECVLGYATSPR